MTERLTSLEYAVISKFCEQSGLEVPDTHDFTVIGRNRDPEGFMTEVSCVKPLRYSRRVYEDLPSAISLPTGTQIGFVLFFEEGLLDAIEGFSYGDPWPESDWPLKFLEG